MLSCARILVLCCIIAACDGLRCYFGYDLRLEVEPRQRTYCDAHIFSCSKIVNERTQRASYGCGLPDYREGCETIEDIYRGRSDIERCYCTEDLCNGAGSIAYHTSLLILALLILNKIVN